MREHTDVTGSSIKRLTPSSTHPRRAARRVLKQRAMWRCGCFRHHGAHVRTDCHDVRAVLYAKNLQYRQMVTTSWREGLVNAATLLRRLTCGDTDSGSKLAEVLGHLGKALESLMEQITDLQKRQEGDRQVLLYGPFLGRSLLEVSMTALLGRFDPFRILTLREVQQANRTADRRHAAAVQWTGDILALKKVTEPWSVEQKPDGMTRALLGDYYERILWQQAFEQLLDRVPQVRGGEWMLKLRRQTPEGFIPEMRRRVAEIYSTLSKGVHHELVISPERTLGQDTILDSMSESIEIVANLSLTANMIRHIPFILEEEDAVRCYEQLQKTDEVMP